MKAATLNLETLMSAQPQVVRVALILVAAALLSACGASTKLRAGSSSNVSGSSDFSSIRDENTDYPTHCSSFKGSTGALAGKITTYYANGIEQEDRMRVRITSAPSSFGSNSDYRLKFFRWKVSNGVIDNPTTPLTFIIEKGTSSSYPITGTMTSLSLTDIQQIRQAYAIPGTTVQEFFNNVVIVVLGLEYEWHAMQAAVYDYSSGERLIDWADGLIPSFSASPSVYAQSHDSRLNGIHPFYGQSGASSASQWQSRANALCF